MQNAAELSPRWATKAGIASHFGIGLRTVTNLMRRRVLPHVKLGRLVRFDLEACEVAFRRYEVRDQR